MARKKKHEEHENHERWLVSYADFITLLFAFFVVMYSVSAVNEGKFRVLSESLVAAFRDKPKSLEPVQLGSPVRSPPLPGQAHDPAPPQPGLMPPLPLPIQNRDNVSQKAAAAAAQAKIEAERAKAISQMAADLEKELAPLIDQNLVSVRRNKFWLEVEIKTSILFPSGSARLANSAIATLKKVAVILSSYPNPIHVEGFTDNQPINTLAFPSNWELSAARAASVVHLFSAAGIQAERMAAIGYGEYQPVADNATAEGRNANRRVVLVVLADPNARRLRDEVRQGAPQDDSTPPPDPAATAPHAGPEQPAATAATTSPPRP